jgi:hypothetical protein
MLYLSKVTYIILLNGDARLLCTHEVELSERTLVLVADIVFRREVHCIALAVVMVSPVDTVFGVFPQSTEL